MLVLEELFRSQKAMSSSHFNLRFQRGLSWLKKSTDLDECPEFKFMSLWIAFRAIHVAEGEEPSALTRIFLQEIYHSDQNGRIATLLWGKLQQSILSLLHSPYLYTEFGNISIRKLISIHGKTILLLKKIRLKMLYNNIIRWKF